MDTDLPGQYTNTRWTLTYLVTTGYYKTQTYLVITPTNTK